LSKVVYQDLDFKEIQRSIACFGVKMIKWCLHSYFKPGIILKTQIIGRVVVQEIEKKIWFGHHLSKLLLEAVKLI
jgi:hypothetical protein